MPAIRLTLVVGSNNWEHRARVALAGRQPVRLVIEGPDGEVVVKQLANSGFVVPKVRGVTEEGVGVDGAVLRVCTIEYLILGTFIALALIVGIAAPTHNAEVRQRAKTGGIGFQTEIDMNPR